MFVFHHDQINMSGLGFYLLSTFTNGDGCCQKGFGSSTPPCQQALSLLLPPLSAGGRAELCWQVRCSFCTAQQPRLLLLCSHCCFVFLQHFRPSREGLQIHSWPFVLPNELLQEEPSERLWSSEPVWVSDCKVLAGQFFCSYK